MEVDLIIKMGFRIRDLYQDIAKLHLEQYGERHPSDLFIVSVVKICPKKILIN
jgi:hypothetical protein